MNSVQQGMYDKLINFMIKVVEKEDEIHMLIQGSGNQVEIRDNRFIFTLKGLYQTLLENGDGSYHEFRRMLYSSRLNSDLLEKGFKVELFSSTQKVDTSWYQLDLNCLES